MAASSRIQTLSLGSQTVSAGIFRAARGGGLILEDYVSRPLPAEQGAETTRNPHVAFALDEVSRSLDSHAEVRYALSGGSVFTRFVKLPNMGDGKVDQLVEFEAQQNVPCPISEVIWDYQLFTEPSGETEVALVAIKADVLNQINEQVEEAGINVSAVDVAPMALLNAFRFNYPDVTEPCMLIDIGGRTTNLVFSEKGRVFCRSLPVGGATVTQAIAKEFQVPLEMAEEKKIRDGFIALGGAYAEHSDPALAALARVARSAMTRIHSEVVRTINYYRSQLGGSQPRMALLCGGGSAMPYTKEFFEEKLSLPVDYFNALRNVSVGSKVEPLAASVAYKLGEHVGLALRRVSGCPMEIDLVPDSVAARRDVQQRKPLWFAAAAAVVAGFAALAAHAHFSSVKSAQMQKELAGKNQEITSLASRMDSEFKKADTIDRERLPMLGAIEQRRVWPGILASLNKYFASDVLWVTDVDCRKDGAPFLPELSGDARSKPPPAPAAPPAGGDKPGDRAKGKDAKPPGIDKVVVRGLWRSNPQSESAGQDQLREIYKAIREDKESPFDGAAMPEGLESSDIENEKGIKISGQNKGQTEETLAWEFVMFLPLKKPIAID